MGRNIGIEAGGIGRKIGKTAGPSKFKIGDRVCIMAPRCCSNRINVPLRWVKHLPDQISLEDGASMVSVYNTAHYALFYKAGLKKGDKVLIHSGAGGVGHAAISICQYVGAEIYATASKAKQDIVRALGVKHVFDSRSTSWFDDLMKVTDGQGVDIVLNSLAGQHQKLGLQALRRFGHFLEIGKMDIYENTKMDLLPFRSNISFHAIDMDPMSIDRPDLQDEIVADVLMHVTKGHYKVLPLTIFPMSKLREGLELIKSGSHIGKVVLVNYEKGPDGQLQPLPVTALDHSHRSNKGEGSILMTGGTGGFGLAMISRMLDAGEKHFIIPTHQGESSVLKSKFKFVLDTPGASVRFIKADLSKEEDVRQVMDVAKAADPPVRKIIHAAGVSVDATLEELTMANFHRVAGCKALAAWHLHDMSKDMELDDFVLISSMAPLIGGKSMNSYAASNAFLDGLIRHHRSQGLAGSTFNMG